MSHADNRDRHFRFFDNREKYLLFATTTSEKQKTAERIGLEFDQLFPSPPSLNVFQAGSGEGTLLSNVLRHLHSRWPTVPFLVVVKENSAEFIRMAARNLADRFSEHPQLVLVFTNQRYGEAPWNCHLGPSDRDRAHWRQVALDGTTSQRFDEQINAVLPMLDDCWAATPGEQAAGAVIVLHRADQAFALHRVIPHRASRSIGYDLIIASSPYRSRLSAVQKVDSVLAPLATSLAPGGRMIVIQAKGMDLGMKIIHQIWPHEAPFPTPRGVLLETLRQRLARAQPDTLYPDSSNERAEFRYHLQLNPEEASSSIGTSTLLAGWNAAAYVAQIDDQRLTSAMSQSHYLTATRRVLNTHHALWFNNECLVVARPRQSATTAHITEI